MSSSAFSSGDSAVLDRETEDEEKIEFENIWSDRQQNDCVHWIKSNQFTKVRLLKDSLFK